MPVVQLHKCTFSTKLQKVSYVLLHAREKYALHNFLSEIFYRSARLQDQCKCMHFFVDDAIFVLHWDLNWTYGLYFWPGTSIIVCLNANIYFYHFARLWFIFLTRNSVYIPHKCPQIFFTPLQYYKIYVSIHFCW